jgi:parvulin-like peptidyl-prolyl isomerase
VPGTDLSQWYRERIEEFIVEALMLQEAREAGLDRGADYVRTREMASQQIEAELCLRHQTRQMAPIERADLEAEYDRQREHLRKPERRLTLHIYRRAGDADARAVASAELADLRDQVLNGEDFARLARAHSDSESRHRGGELGWLNRGELPEEVDAVVFALDEGVPSQPLATADGVHLLMVQSVSPAREATLVEALPLLRERLLLQRAEMMIKPIVEADTRDFAMPDASGLAALLQAGDADALVLADGDYQLDVAAFRRHLAQLSERQSGRGETSITMAWNALRALRTREKLRAACAREAWLDADVLTAALSRWEREQLVSLQRRALLRALAESDEARLRLYHSQNPDQFSTPVRWTLRRLQIPLAADASATMASLERAAQDPQSSVDALQQMHGGELQTLTAQRAVELRRIAPTLPALVAPLEPGQLSAPLRTVGHLEIYQLVSREEPVAASFDSAREQVISNVVRQHAAELYQRHVEQVLAAESLRINPDALQQLVAAGLPQAEISPEALAQLLEAL